MLLTNHGAKRVSQRIGLSRKYTAEHIEHVLKFGWGINMFSSGSAFKKYLNVKAKKDEKADIRVYGHYIYIFKDEVLITVLNVPYRFLDFLRKVMG